MNGRIFSPFSAAVGFCIAGFLLMRIVTRHSVLHEVSKVIPTLVETHLKERHHESHKKSVLYIAAAPPCSPTNAPLIMVNNVWQVAMDQSGKGIFAFGAYWDDRPSVSKQHGSFAVIRLFTVSTYTIEKDVFCQVRTKEGNLLEITVAAAEDSGRGFAINKTVYQERMITCLVGRQSEDAALVSLTFKACEKATNQLEIYRYRNSEPRMEIGVCVAVTYGRINPTAIAEWIEFHKLLGVSEFHFYESQLNSKSRGALRVYENKGLVKVRPSAPPVRNWCKWCQKLAVIPALQDCMYRNMYRFNYLLVMDVDEYLVPREHISIPEMLATFPSALRPKVGSVYYPTSSYIFRNAYFFFDFGPSETDSKFLLTNKYVKRADVSKVGYAGKSIINPRLCVIMQNHYCVLRTEDPMDTWVWLVPETSAILQHYKKCHLSQLECSNMLNHSTVDTNALRFAQKVNEEVHNVLPFFETL